VEDKFIKNKINQQVMIPTINIEDKIREINGRPFTPIDVARVNDQVVRMALVRGAYRWHQHTDEDELFYVIKGRMTIQMKSPYSNITLSEGEMAVIPKGVEHCPISKEDTYILMFEPSALQSKGD
jgi:mannose-6-phosphate isomerase-like protein (cupin superfamily)